MSRQNLEESRSFGKTAGIWWPKALYPFPMRTRFVLTRIATWSTSHWRTSTAGRSSGSWNQMVQRRRRVPHPWARLLVSSYLKGPRVEDSDEIRYANGLSRELECILVTIFGLRSLAIERMEH